MTNKTITSTLALFITLLIIFFVTYFNQQRYYDIQEKNRKYGYENILKAKSETNKMCLKYAPQDECLSLLIKSIQELNPAGSGELTQNNKVIVSWNNERHKDDRDALVVSKKLEEFQGDYSIKLSKLTRHQNLVKSSFNAMFLSVLDYADAFSAWIKGEPSTFGDMNAFTFFKYIAWGRFYPVLPIWIIALGLLTYTLNLVFRNRKLQTSLDSLQKDILHKENLLHRMKIDKDDIQHSFNELQTESSNKIQNLSNEKDMYSQKVAEYANNFEKINSEKQFLHSEILRTENLEKNRTQESLKLEDQLKTQEKLLLELNEKQAAYDVDMSKTLQEKAEYKKEYTEAKEKFEGLQSLLSESKNNEIILSEKLNDLNQSLDNLNTDLSASKSDQLKTQQDLENKAKELNEFLSYVSDMEDKYKNDIQRKSDELELIKNNLSELQTQKEKLEINLDQIVGNDISSRKIFNILVKNPEMPKSMTYEYSEPEHHSKAYLKSIHNAFNSQKNYKIGGLITDLRGTKFNSKTPNTLRIVKDYAVSPDITRAGFGLVAVEKDHGYAAYIHLTASSSAEAMLAAKAIQTYCSVFKNYKIISLNDLSVL